MPKIDKVKLVKGLARQRIGAVKRSAVIVPKPKKKAKYKEVKDPFEW